MGSKGNRKMQNKRRNARFKLRPPRQKEAYELIDGNYSHYPVAVCTRMKGCLTVGLAELHGCVERKCNKYIPFEEKENKDKESNYAGQAEKDRDADGK